MFSCKRQIYEKVKFVWSYQKPELYLIDRGIQKYERNSNSTMAFSPLLCLKLQGESELLNGKNVSIQDSLIILTYLLIGLNPT